jgi:hypothetical protein
MKIRGKKIEGPNEEVIIIPRGDEPIILKARAVLDYKEFNAICPAPKPPIKMHRSGQRVPDFTNSNYQKEFDRVNTARVNWMILKSLDVPENEIEWETIDMSDPDTWGNFENELRAAGFSDIEIGRITTGVMSANGLDDAKVEEARMNFLASQQDQAAQE